MKIRSDFVSNSSSSSFIVKAEPNVPEIFSSEKKYGFAEFVTENLRRDVFSCFDEACYGWNDWQQDRDIRLIPDAEFAAAYTSWKTPNFVLPESCRKYVKDICSYIDNVLDIEAEKPPILLENGEQSAAMAEKWNRDKYRRLYEEKVRLDKILGKACKIVANVLRPVMENWSFYCAELEDSDGSEQRGFDAVQETSWYRIFSNH